MPNLALAAAGLAGIGLLLATGRGPVAAGWLDSLFGLALATLWWLPGWWLGRLGAGDVKFAACIGFLLGAAATVEALLLACVALGIMALMARVRPATTDVRLPAAVALAAGLLGRLGWGPVWMH